jgi:hypothetical protein
MSTLSPNQLPAAFQDADEKLTMANAVAYHSLTMFIQDCKNIVTACVKKSINSQLNSPQALISAHGKSRKQALRLWSKSDKPLSWGSTHDSTSCSYKLLLIILNNNPHGQHPSLQKSQESFTHLDLAKRFLNISQKTRPVAPVSANGSFFPALPIAITRITNILPENIDKASNPVIAIFARMLKTMDIHFVPWHKSDKLNSQAYIVQGDWWLMLKAGPTAQITKALPPPPEDLNEAVAKHARLMDPSAPWTLPEKLEDMGPLWRKVTLPVDWAMPNASLPITQSGDPNHYVRHTYQYVRTSGTHSWLLGQNQQHLKILFSILS